MKNPNFKETNKILIKEKEVSDILVYELKNIQNAFYFACLIFRNNIQIHKYSYETKSFKTIARLDVNGSYAKGMKYLYNPLDKKEYFFIINGNDEIEVYLIKNENTFKLIQKLNYINKEDLDIINNNNNKNKNKKNNKIIDLDDSFDRDDGGVMFTSFNFLNVIYHEGNVYVIINYLLMQNAGGDDSSLDYYRSKSINIFKFKDVKLKLIKTFIFETDFNMNCLIYINNDSGKKYLVNAYQNDNLILIELKSNYNNYQIENFFSDVNNKNMLANFIRGECFYDSCIIYGKNNFDFLYILQGNKLMIINFTMKNVDKIIDFNQTYFLRINNWNNNYIIFFQFRTIYVFDINNNKILQNIERKIVELFKVILFQVKKRILEYLMIMNKLNAILYKFKYEIALKRINKKIKFIYFKY